MANSKDDNLLNDAIPIDELEIIEDDNSSEDPLLQDAISIDELEVVEDEPQEVTPVRKAAEMEEIELADDDDSGEKAEIVTFEKGRKEDDAQRWNRTPDPESHSAIRCRSFVAKLRIDAVEHMDEQINEWLDAHPEYTIKHVVSTIGVLKGKEKEDALFVSVFV